MLSNEAKACLLFLSLLFRCFWLSCYCGTLSFVVLGDAGGLRLAHRYVSAFFLHLFLYEVRFNIFYVDDVDDAS